MKNNMDNPIKKVKRKKLPEPTTEYKKLTLRHRQIEELRNKIERTVYAIVDYDTMRLKLKLTKAELYHLMEAAERAVLHGAGYEG